MTDPFDHTPEEAAAYTAGQRAADEMRDALERISDAYPGDHDYPGIIARRALDAANHATRGDA